MLYWGRGSGEGGNWEVRVYHGGNDILRFANEILMPSARK